MSRLKSWFMLVVGAVALSLLAAAPALAQGSFFSSLSGTVVDSAGLMIPGASVKVKNYRLTALLGDNQSRIIQLVARVRF